MKTKDKIIQATDKLGEVLSILARVNVDNEKQKQHSIQSVCSKLIDVINLIKDER